MISFFSGFNTTVDVKLQQWAEKELPRQCVEIGHNVLLNEFQDLIEREQKSRSYDSIANDLKMQVVEACRRRHQWDTKALDSLVEINIFILNFNQFLIYRELFKLKHYKIVMYRININGKQLRNLWKMLFEKN